jgi:Type I phosphodiesterase / nucleotide pyrophosphatase
MRNAESRVIGISIKDRSAILPAGHMADAAYRYDSDSNNWVTSTYYRADLPAWAQEVNARHTYQRYLGAKWLPLGVKDVSTTPFCSMVNGSDDRYCGGLEATPWGNEMIEEFAEHAIDGEQMGRHPGVDFLAISLSANDYIGHAVGPDDPAVRDISIRTDQLLGKLFDFVDQRIGAGNTLVVLTADHGVAPLPELNQARTMPGGRLSEPKLRQKMTRFGPGEWLLPGTVTTPYLNLNLVHTRRLDPAAVERTGCRCRAHRRTYRARLYPQRTVERRHPERPHRGSGQRGLLWPQIGRFVHFARALLFVRAHRHFPRHALRVRYACAIDLSWTRHKTRHILGGGCHQ